MKYIFGKTILNGLIWLIGIFAAFYFLLNKDMTNGLICLVVLLTIRAIESSYGQPGLFFKKEKE